jgi:hypothetical protein
MNQIWMKALADIRTELVLNTKTRNIRIINYFSYNSLITLKFESKQQLNHWLKHKMNNKNKNKSEKKKTKIWKPKALNIWKIWIIVILNKMTISIEDIPKRRSLCDSLQGWTRSSQSRDESCFGHDLQMDQIRPLVKQF